MKENSMVTCAALLLNYNHSEYIEKSLKSIINQSIPFDEILIIDDCSNDNSVEIIKKIITKKKKISLIINKKNTGVISNLNKGTKILKSDYIYFVSADDSYNANIVHEFKKAIFLFPSISMISGNVYRKRNNTKKEKLILPFKTPDKICNPSIYAKTAKDRVTTFFGGGNIIKKDLILSLGGFESSLMWSADWFLYQLIGFTEKVYITEEFFMTIKTKNDSFSQNLLNWEHNKVLITNFFNLILGKHSKHFDFFKSASILPFYDFRILILLLKNKEFRKIITPLLIWRLLTYNIFKKLNNIVPKNWHIFIRKFIKV